MSRRDALAAGISAAILIATLGGCGMHDSEQVGDRAREEGDVPAEPSRPELPDWRKMWDFSDGPGTERRFAETVPIAEASGDATHLGVLLTQLARSRRRSSRAGRSLAAGGAWRA